MMIEAANIPGWKPTKVKRRLLQQPALLQNLTQFQAAIDAVLKSRLQVLAIAPRSFSRRPALAGRRGY